MSGSPTPRKFNLYPLLFLAAAFAVGIVIENIFQTNVWTLIVGIFAVALASYLYRDETIAFISKRDPSPLEAIKVDYEVTKASMTEDGSLPDDVLRDEVTTRAELITV